MVDLVKHFFLKTKVDSEDGIYKLYALSPIISTIVLLIAIFGTLFGSTAFRQAIGYYDLKLCRDGDYCFYVELDNGKKTYTVPAKISIVSYEDGDERNNSTYRDIYLDKVYWSNGGYLTFEDQKIKIDKKTSVEDTHEKEYDCTLLNKHAFTSKFKEKSAKASEYVLLITELLAILIVWFNCIYNHHKHHEE